MKQETCVAKINETFSKVRTNLSGLLGENISILNLSINEYDVLKNNGIFTLHDLVNFNPDEFYVLFNDSAVICKINRNLLSVYYEFYYPDVNISDPYNRLDAILNRIAKMDEKTILSPIPIINNASVRLYNCLKRSSYENLSDLINAGSEKISRIQNLGRKSIKELCDLLEAFCENGLEDLPIIEKKEKEKSVFDKLAEMPESFLMKPIDLDPNNARMNNSFKNSNIYSYADLMELGSEGLLRLPNLGRKTYKQIVELLEIVIENENSCLNGASQKLNYCSLLIDKINKFEITDDSFAFSFDDTFRDIRSELESIIYNIDFSLSNRMLDIFRRRNNNTHIETLEEVANHYNLTRERIRQIEAKTTKIIIGFFASYMKQLTDVSVSNFYKRIYTIEDDKIISFINWLISNKDVVSQIIKKCIIDNINTEKKCLFDSKKAVSCLCDKGTGVNTLGDIFGENEFYNCIENIDNMCEVSNDIYAGWESGVKASIELNNFIRKLKIKNNSQIRIIAYPLIDSFSCDLAFVIKEQYVILINLFNNVTDLIERTTINKYGSFISYCKTNGYGCAWCSSSSVSMYSLRSKEISRKKKVEILNYLSKGPANFEDALKNIKTGANILCAISLQNGYVFNKNNKCLELADSNFIETNDDEYIISKIKSTSFSETQKNVFLGFLELEKNYIRPKKKNIYFGILRVFLTGYQQSHLYEQCKNFEYFGRCREITPHELREVLEWLEKLDLIISGITPHGKTFYYSNGKMISKSRILQILLNKTSDINDFMSLLSDIDIDED